TERVLDQFKRRGTVSLRLQVGDHLTQPRDLSSTDRASRDVCATRLIQGVWVERIGGQFLWQRMSLSPRVVERPPRCIHNSTPDDLSAQRARYLSCHAR